MNGFPEDSSQAGMQSLTCLLPQSSLFPQSWMSHIRYTGCCWEKQQVSPITSCAARVVGPHSVLSFSPKRDLAAAGYISLGAAFSGEVGQGGHTGKVFLTTTSTVTKLLFFL